MSLTLTELQTRVLSNNFGSGRYTTLATAFLNDAVADACRALKLNRQYSICAYAASTGLVTQPTLPFFRIESVWLTSAGATGSGEEAVRVYSTTPLAPLPSTTTAALAGQSGTPVYYTARRDGSVSTGLAVRVTPAPSAAGHVAIVGLAQPAAMSATTDVTGLGGNLDLAIIAFAKARCFEVEDDFEASAFWDTRYRQLLGVASLDGQDDGPSQTPGTDADFDSLAFGGR